MNMARTKKLTPKVVEAIQADIKRGLTYAESARKNKVSVGSVGNALKVRLPEPQPDPKKKKKKKAPKPIEPESVEADPPNDIELRKMLARNAKQAMAHRGRLVRDDPGDTSGIAAATRAVTAATLLLHKVTPQAPPVEDPNTMPCMVEAAAEGRSKIHAILDRVYAERDAAAEAEKAKADAAPKCERCAQPMISAEARVAHREP